MLSVRYGLKSLVWTLMLICSESTSEKVKPPCKSLSVNQYISPPSSCASQILRVGTTCSAGPGFWNPDHGLKVPAQLCGYAWRGFKHSGYWNSE
ncbi:hypothetical protein BDQ12DRAFT_682685 [Crucibulum laeve]|uniref:Uncharacterized protein n=1 Tax=Crucibulum laeve TaxID=68775 RepID=A0A5C3M175_9AGAR|nr:hypothetical protein BDQ12DRAFT_682685 [Crucibulum laeve]